MREGLDALTDKEKETLRLMARGHDAKSLARELSLSVHTINERLRASRRKLGVTSSREAARLLFEHDAADPQNLADKRFGEAGRPNRVEPMWEAAGRSSRRILAGAMIMMTLFAAGLVLTSQPTEVSHKTVPMETPASDAEVVAAAREWLAFTDSGDWQASFDAAGKAFRDVNTPSSWARAAEQVREEQGALVSRDSLTVRYLNAPPRGFQEVVFSTQYENREDKVIETLTLQMEEGEWRVVGILLD